MKLMLAYLEVFMDMMKHAFEMDLSEEIAGFVNRVRVLSGITIGVVVFFAIGVKFRAKSMRRDRKFATQVVKMISLKTIKDCSRLKDVWGNIDFEFYE